MAGRSDLVLFIRDGDLTETEIRALRVLASHHRPIILVDEQGNETETLRQPRPDIGSLRERLWSLLESEGKTLAAPNASMFAIDLSDQVGKRILKARRVLGARLIRSYCVAKGVAVAFNPVPVADLLAAAALDAGMVVHLSKLYGLPLSRYEAGDLVKTIATQLAVLMGTVWVVNLASAAMKLGTGGLSTVLTGTAQGAVAYYSTYVVGQAAESFLAHGKSWGRDGTEAGDPGHLGQHRPGLHPGPGAGGYRRPAAVGLSWKICRE